MVELTDLFNPGKRYLIGKKIINLNNYDDEILIKIGDKVLRCHVDGFQQKTIYPFDYADYNNCYINQTAVPTSTYSTNQYFFMNTYQNNKINLDLCVYGEIIV